tara:strand:- start:1206 stop:1643 length:438 start_codon:yes stop_codon:yes gene_type:complete
MSYIPTHDELAASLSPYFLENNPKGFLENLKWSIKNKIDISGYINDNTYYDTWYSSLPMCLVYLVGNLENPDEKKDLDFYGRDMEINNDLGIELMSYLYLGGADLTIVDYYDDDIYDYIDTLGSEKYILTRRTNNKKFIDFLMGL